LEGDHSDAGAAATILEDENDGIVDNIMASMNIDDLSSLPASAPSHVSCA
jgi:hypothetical protein